MSVLEQECSYIPSCCCCFFNNINILLSLLVLNNHNRMRCLQVYLTCCSTREGSLRGAVLVSQRGVGVLTVGLGLCR